MGKHGQAWASMGKHGQACRRSEGDLVRPIVYHYSSRVLRKIRNQQIIERLQHNGSKDKKSFLSWAFVACISFGGPSAARRPERRWAAEAPLDLCVR
jgi:hypothetical protein